MSASSMPLELLRQRSGEQCGLAWLLSGYRWLCSRMVLKVSRMFWNCLDVDVETERSH